MLHPKTITREIDGHRVAITRIQGRAYLHLGAVAMTTLGPALASMLSGAGIRLREDSDEVVTLEQIAAGGADAIAKVVSAALRRFGSVDPDALLAMADELLLGNVEIDGVRVTTPDVLDVALGDKPLTLLRVIVAAFQHNFFPTSPAEPTAAGSSGDATSNRPGVTRSARPASRV